jgi:hypothetical protein
MGLFDSEKAYTIQVVHRHQTEPRTSCYVLAASPADALRSDAALAMIFRFPDLYAAAGGELVAGPLRSLSVSDGESESRYDDALAEEIAFCLGQMEHTGGNSTVRSSAHRLNKVLDNELESYRQRCEVGLSDGTTLAYDVVMIASEATTDQDMRRLYQLAGPLSPEQRDSVTSVKLAAVPSAGARELECLDPGQATLVLERSWNGLTSEAVDLMTAPAELSQLVTAGAPALGGIGEAPRGSEGSEPSTESASDAELAL